MLSTELVTMHTWEASRQANDLEWLRINAVTAARIMLQDDPPSKPFQATVVSFELSVF